MIIIIFRCVDFVYDGRSMGHI